MTGFGVQVGLSLSTIVMSSMVSRGAERWSEGNARRRVEFLQERLRNDSTGERALVRAALLTETEAGLYARWAIPGRAHAYLWGLSALLIFVTGSLGAGAIRSSTAALYWGEAVLMVSLLAFSATATRSTRLRRRAAARDFRAGRLWLTTEERQGFVLAPQRPWAVAWAIPPSLGVAAGGYGIGMMHQLHAQSRAVDIVTLVTSVTLVTLGMAGLCGLAILALRGTIFVERDAIQPPRKQRSRKWRALMRRPLVSLATLAVGERQQ